MNYSFLSFLRGPMNAALSWGVWKRPWPNLEEVSMNFKLTFSKYLFLVWVRRDFLRVRILFLVWVRRDLLQIPLLGMGQEGLSEGEDSLLVSNASSLQEDEVLLNFSIVRESTHGVDGLIGQIVLGGGVVLDKLAILHLVTLSDPVDLLVDLGTVMESLLSSPGNGELDSARMPGSNTSNLPQTLVSLPGQLLCVPTGSHTLESVTLGDTNNVNALILSKDSGDGNLLLKVFSGEVNLVGDASTVQLNLHDVSLLLPPVEQLHLGVDY